jgi:hypothetical protein
MNIKFSDRAVRCRVSRVELDRLLSGRAVILEVPLPRSHVFRGNIWPGAMTGWQLESDPTGIWITIPKSELQQLAESLPNKEGIEHAFEVEEGTVTVSFEVDVRDRGVSSKLSNERDDRVSEQAVDESVSASNSATEAPGASP